MIAKDILRLLKKKKKKKESQTILRLKKHSPPNMEN
jgi:hypothetical protein